MGCPTCDSTIESVGRLLDDPDCGVFHCPRCGTLRVGGYTYVPRLVERCRRLHDEVYHPPTEQAVWHRLGIYEAIYPPDGRPAP
jgi:tRNA(Ile2) C34 agmatinyltransferase TiaS